MTDDLEKRIFKTEGGAFADVKMDVEKTLKPAERKWKMIETIMGWFNGDRRAEYFRKRLKETLSANELLMAELEELREKMMTWRRRANKMKTLLAGKSGELGELYSMYHRNLSELKRIKGGYWCSEKAEQEDENE